MTIVSNPAARARDDHSADPNQLTAPEPAGSGSVWWLPVVGLVAAILCLPFFRSVFWLGDEGVLLHGAERILQGQRLYVDFFEFLPPGGFLITAAWFGLAGISMPSARVLAILTIVGIACFTYLACRQACRNAAISALIAVGWVVMSQGFWTQISHKAPDADTPAELQGFSERFDEHESTGPRCAGCHFKALDSREQKENNASESRGDWTMDPDKRSAWLRRLDEECPYQVVLPRR